MRQRAAFVGERRCGWERDRSVAGHGLVLGFVCMHVYCRCISFITLPRRGLLSSYFLHAAVYRNEDDTTTNLHINVQTHSISSLVLDISTRNESLDVTESHCASVVFTPLLPSTIFPFRYLLPRGS